MIAVPSILGVFAHPDDETFGVGGLMAKYARRGVQVRVVCATRGEAGQVSDPGLIAQKSLAEVRERELRDACQALGIGEPHFLGFADGKVNAYTPREVEARITQVIRDLKPDVLITWGPDGGYGHPDHVAIHEYTTAAVASASDPTQFPDQLDAWVRPHQVQKLYFVGFPQSFWQKVQELWGEGMGPVEIDGQQLQMRGTPDEQITTVIDISEALDAKLAAIQCHKSQSNDWERMLRVPEELRHELFAKEYLVRAIPAPIKGEPQETEII